MTAGSAWLSAANYVVKNGHDVKDGGENLKEVLDLFITVDNANEHDKIIEKFADPEMIDWMVNKNFGGKEPVLNWGYCYGMRFDNFNGVNQIQEIEEKLAKNPEAKSATISLTKPEVDFQGHMPCIVALDFKLREGKLLLTGFFRSQDIGKKFYADILALGSIQQKVAIKLGVECGQVKIFICSAHIYEKDFASVERMLSKV
jgi:thymidylate synthase